jgi:hypothetical protein
MDFRFLVAVGFVLLFHRMAVYERITGWAWAVASLALSLVVMVTWAGFLPIILAQLGLFGLMWWYNARKVDERHRELAARREAERRAQGARRKWAQEEIQRERKNRDAE